MSHILSISRIQVLAIIALAVVAFAPALTAEAATAQIAATPTTLVAGNSATLSWNCYNSVTASLNQGIGGVANSGSMQVSPQITKTYTVVCTDATTAASASVTITVDNQGCYENTEADVTGEAIYPTFDESAAKVIFNIDGPNAMNGGGLYDSANHYQKCINECAAYGTCNYKYTQDYGFSENSQTRYKCMYVDPVTGPVQAKATETTVAPSSGNISKETIYWAIQYTTTSGGTCTPPPPAPTATLTASPANITTGQSSTLTWSSTNADQCIGTGFTAGAVSGTRSVSPTATKDYYVTCTNTAGSASASARVTVGASPDLISGGISPTTATSSVAKTFSATITNNGATTTAVSFPVLFQRATSVTGANTTDLGSTTTAVLAANANRVVSYSATLPTAGTWYMRACADKRSGGDVNGLVAGELSENNNCGGWTQITVVAGTATYPNLVTGNVSPGTAVVGTARTFSSTVQNAGSVTTGQTTQNVFQIDNNLDHTTVTATVAGSASPTLAVNATNVTSANYTFSTATTYYVRACADTNTSLAGAVLESNETDNCSPWKTVTVTASDSGTVLSCTPSASSVAVGGTVTWSATPSTYGAFAYTWDPSEAAAQASKPATFNRTYSTAGNYGMDVTVTSTGETDSCGFVTVGNPCTSPDITLTAVPARVTTGQTAVITFSASGISGSCTLSGPGLGSQPAVTANMCNVADTTVTTPAITAQSTYTVTCTDGTTESIVVNVIPRFQEF